MYHVRFDCMMLEDFNKRLALKKSPITQKEILKALAEISIYKSNISFVNNAQYDKAVECVMGFIDNQEILEPTIYYNLKDLLCELKENGVLDENSPLEDLAEQVDDETYETMYNYLVEC